MLQDMLSVATARLRFSTLVLMLPHNSSTYIPLCRRMYSQWMGGVRLDFALHVRRTPVTLAQIEKEVRAVLV